MENHTKDILQGQEEVVRLNQDIGSATVDEDASRADYTYDEMDYNTSYNEANNTSSYTTQFAYASGASAYGANATTPLVSSITQGEGENAMNFAYTYDNRGNIISETRNGVTTTYEYDALGQLVRVNDPHENATWIYSYDCGGNILNKAKYAYTTEGELGEAIESIPYTYGDANWKDKLTAYNGVPITYDAIGNPLNDGTWTYEWQAGRQLKSMTNVVNGVMMEFTYNHAGIRTKKEKKVNGVLAETTEYILNGKIVVGLTYTDHASNEVDTMHFFYDAQGRAAQVDFNDAVYSYIYNFQGNIVGMIDNSGSLVVEYKYNAWGKRVGRMGALAETLGKLNPFWYRGYIYDEEAGLYYLRSRYYNPIIGRFANADDIIKPKALLSSLYAYCANNPVVRVDYSGKLYVSLELYTIALSAQPYEKFDFSNTLLGMKFTERIRASKVVKSRVADYIKDIPKGARFYSKTEKIYWGFGESLKDLSMSDLDLALAVGHASNMTITVEKVEEDLIDLIFFGGDKYKVTYTLNDRYDFDRWEGTDRETAPIWLNDTFGFEPQEAGILNKYDYTCSGSYCVYVNRWGWVM